MIYLSSKGEQVDVQNMNDFHLKGAHDKAQRLSNHLTMIGSEALRYVEIIRINLWREIERRSNK